MRISPGSRRLAIARSKGGSRFSLGRRRPRSRAQPVQFQRASYLGPLISLCRRERGHNISRRHLRALVCERESQGTARGSFTSTSTFFALSRAAQTGNHRPAVIDLKEPERNRIVADFSFFFPSL